MTNETVAFVTDIHPPYQYDPAIELTQRILKDIQPDQLIIGGDAFDFYQASHFNKSPERLASLQYDIDIGVDILRNLQSQCKADTKYIFLVGNHEERLEKFLLRNAAQLSKLRCLNMEELLELRKMGFSVYDKRTPFIYKGVLYKHGNRVRKHSGYTAKSYIDDYMMNVVTGHTHRMAMVKKTISSGIITSIESGHLSDINKLEYMALPGNWQMGITIITYIDDIPFFNLVEYNVIGNELTAMINKKIYRSTND